MVGGKVIEVAEVPGRPEILFVDCADMPRGRRKPDTCAIYVERNKTSEQIQIGDSLWWQGPYAMWTPQRNRMVETEAERRGLKCGVDYDIKIPRVGCSGVTHPARKGK